MDQKEHLIEELARLSPEELSNVLESLENRLVKNKQLKIAEQVIKKYKPALIELAQ